MSARFALPLVLITLLCGALPAPAQPIGTYDGWWKHRAEALKDPSVLAYYTFDDLTN